MRVLLISANTEQLQMPVLPMGLACVAGSVERAGHEVRLLNLMTRSDFGGWFESAFEDFRPELIGISVRNIDDQCMNSPKFLLEPVREIVSACRNLTAAPIVLGGAGYSIYPRSALTYLGADMGIRGEGEAAILKLIEGLSRNDLRDVPNLILPESEHEPKIIRMLDDFPLPVPNGALSIPTEVGSQKIWLPFQTRRGCAMDCSYCSTAAIEGRRLRKRSTELVVQSISRFVQAGFTNFFFVDNTFNFPPSYAKELCDRFIERKLGIQWRCILYPWKIDEELIEKLARAGCVEVSFGFESGSTKILRALNKRYEPEDIRGISKILEKYGIVRCGFLLLGGPGETTETVEQSLEFADSLELEAMKVTAGIRIYPYTALAAVALSEGVISPENDLLLPVFYLANGLGGWIEQKISDWINQRPHWFR